MATFSENQVRQLYVSKAYKEAKVVAADAAGTIGVGNDTAKTHLYFEYKGADNLMRSDLIDPKQILWAKATDADALAQPLKRFKIVLNSAVNSGAPVANQDYVLRIAFRNYVGLSEEDQYFKYGNVKVVTGMTASNFYKSLVLSLVKNFSREESQLLKFYL
ncbi:MAG: hypothetical protein HUJ56_08540, partial [Erysipelotrichaceae bacterium]|nr:hypothetical protein [Erysipelotrichaceae bacterium]